MIATVVVIHRQRSHIPSMVKFEHVGVHEIGQISHLDYHSTG